MMENLRDQETNNVDSGDQHTYMLDNMQHATDHNISVDDVKKHFQRELSPEEINELKPKRNVE